MEGDENVGGISIGVGIDDSGLDSGEELLLTRMKGLAQRLSAELTITPGIGATQAPVAASRAAQPAQRPLPVQQPAAITFGAAARQNPANQTAFQRRVNEELAKNGEQLVDGVVVQIDSAKKQTAQAVSRAVSDSGQARQTTSVAIALDTSDFREQFGSFLAELKTLMARASAEATVKLTADSAAPQAATSIPAVVAEAKATITTPKKAAVSPQVGNVGQGAAARALPSAQAPTAVPVIEGLAREQVSTRLPSVTPTPSEPVQAPTTAPLFHGSPQADLTVASANPAERQFDNATSQFGAFVTPSRREAERYAGATGQVYEAAAPAPQNPYEMSRREFDYFQSPERAPTGETLPADQWKQRAEELKVEAATLRQRLVAQGHGGITVPGNRGNAPEVASFSDIPLRPAPQATTAPITQPSGNGGGYEPPPTITSAPGEDEDQPKPARRKNIRDRSIGTEADQSRIYTFDPAVYEEEDRRKEAKASAQRQILATTQQRRKVNPSDAEQRLLNSMSQPTSSTVTPDFERHMRELSYEAEQNTSAGKTSATFATPASPAEATRQREEEARRSNEQANRPQRTSAEQAAYLARPDVAGPQGGSSRYQGPPGRGGGGGRGRPSASPAGFDPDTTRAFEQAARVRTQEVDERAIERTVASRRAAITGSGRTSRTLVSGLGALFGGSEGRQFEAQAQASAAARQLRGAEAAIAPLDNRLRELAKTWGVATGAQRENARDQFLGIRRTDEYRAALGNVKSAIQDDADAQDRLNKISSGTSIVRNLVAITAAGAAFGVGLKAIQFIGDAAGGALSNLIDIQTGFGATSTRVTTALGAQTLALHGNVDAALAGAEATAGLSAGAADALNSQLRLTTQIKAGAQAQQQASELFRAGAGVGNAPSGLFGGFGGIGGTGLLAQQLGGGRGFTETIQQDLAGFQGKRGPDILGNINQGLAYVGNQGTREYINQQSQEQGNVLGNITAGVAGTPGAVANTISSLNPFGKNFLEPFTNADTGQRDRDRPRDASGNVAAPAPTISNEGIAYLNNLNAAAERSAPSLKSASQATVEFTNDAAKIAAGTQGAAQAGDAYGVTLAQQQHIVVMLGDAVAESGDKYKQAIEQFATGAGIADPAVLARQSLAAERQRQIESAANLDTIRAQQAFVNPSIVAGAGRQQDFALNQQQPAQAALQNLAQPLLPVGTGIAANADEQGRLAAGQQRSVDLQKDLNAYYKEGQQVIADTYRPAIVTNFGAAAGAAFDSILGKITANGQEIASIQAGISNESAQYQTAQYNFQLLIAKRTLSDIGGLTGRNFGAGESYLGSLERQNLALSRQGQLLQFNLSQRQINFQTAVAGFQAPGVTPEERQANVKEAQIETSYAQKQLDIQKQMFGNQVQIVDISNLRQGADLAAQIGLLLQGRKVTIDTQQAQERLALLSQQQAILVTKAGTYLGTINNLTSVAFSQISQLEAAAGKAMGHVATDVLKQFGIFLNGMTSQLNGVGGGTQNTGGGGLGGGGQATTGDNDSPALHAAGGVYDTMAPTRIGNGVMGEAAGETVAIIAHPRSLLDAPSEGGGANISITFGDTYVRDQSDIDDLVRKVTQALGRTASQIGLRGIG